MLTGDKGGENRIMGEESRPTSAGTFSHYTRCESGTTSGYNSRQQSGYIRQVQEKLGQGSFVSRDSGSYSLSESSDDIQISEQQSAQEKIMDVYGEMKTALEKLPEASTSAGSVEKQCEELKSENSLYRTELMNAMDVLAAIQEDYQEKTNMITKVMINLNLKTGIPFPKKRSNLTMPPFPPTTPREDQSTSEDTPNTANCYLDFCEEEGGNTSTQCTTTPILQTSTHSLVKTTAPRETTFAPPSTPHGATFTPQGAPSTPHGATTFHYGTTPTHHRTTPTLLGGKHPLMKTTTRHGDSSIPHQLMQSYRGGTPVLKDITHPLEKTTSHHGTTPTCNGTTPTCNGITPTHNRATPTHNRATPTPQDIPHISEDTTVRSNRTTSTLTKIPEKQDSADSLTSEEHSPPRSAKSDAETTSQRSQTGKSSRSDHRRKQSQTRDPVSFLPELAAVYSQKSPLLKESKPSYLPKLPKRKTM